MIIKGGSLAGATGLGRYLQSMEVNERAVVIETRGTVAPDIVGAMKEMEAYAEGTKCEHPLYHAMISPEPPYRLTAEQREEALSHFEEKFGFSGQARVVVVHEKKGREHIHVVWSRIDLENMRAIPDSHNFAKHEQVARQLERMFGHPRVQGAHAERDGAERPDRSPSRAELRQEELTGVKSKDVRAEVTALFRASDGAEAFRTALEDAGYVLAKGDRRDFVIVDRAGGEHSLARRVSGMKAAALREFMAPLDRESLPSVEEAKGIVQDRLSGGSDFDRACWEDALAANAIEAERNDKKQNALDREANAEAIAWEDAVAKSAIEKTGRDDLLAKQRRQERFEDHLDNLIESAYARGDDYVSQTRAALKDHIRRQDAADIVDPRPHHPDARVADEERKAEIYEDHDRRRRRAEERSTQGHLLEDRVAQKFSNVEMTEAQQQRMERLQNAEGGERAHSPERDDLEPDRQREAPGGGRTRGR